MRKILYFACACFLFQYTQAQNRPAQSRYGSEPATVLEKFKAGVDSCDVDLRVHRPLIGLSTGQNGTSAVLKASYIQAILKAGGVPALIPVMTDGAALREIVAGLDGLVMTGGEDVDPQWYGESPRQQLGEVDPERDRYDIKLVKLAADRNIPILGICRGEQLINVAFGGSLIQDIPTQAPHSTINHSQDEERRVGTHTVNICPDSRLHEIVKAENILVNSFHHQAVKVVAPGFEAVAFSDDGITEAIESTEGRSILGVQWHPEHMAVAGNEIMTDTFRHLVSEADLYRKARDIHRKYYIIDTHCDTPMHFSKGANIGKNNKNTSVDVPKMQEGWLDAAFMVAYISQGTRTSANSQKA
ncbi:MAG: gamma-glutamyl-gamma-aminobutyrate hydrolase family protein, partial [Tannerella sp.]|nr:gamma-glutamyl-gamma-aminobutyrate hydrolase family protein [Tannerella sp.]